MHIFRSKIFGNVLAPKTHLEGTFLTMGVMRPLWVATATEMSIFGIT